MASQGWKRGEGLGASGSGIINPLRVQIEKRKQRSDADGGGFVGPGGKGKIVGGGKRKKTTTTTTGGSEAEEREEHGKFGPMSEVVVARGMLLGMDVDVEIANGLLQELGEECEAKVRRFIFFLFLCVFLIGICIYIYIYIHLLRERESFYVLTSLDMLIVWSSRPGLYQS